MYIRNIEGKGNGKVFYGQELPNGKSTTNVCGVNYQLLAVMLLKYQNEQLLVAVDRSHLWTMASETVDPDVTPHHLQCSTPPSATSPVQMHVTQECSRRDSIPWPSEYKATALPMRPLICARQIIVS